jgi:hypothetical protein
VDWPKFGRRQPNGASTPILFHSILQNSGGGGLEPQWQEGMRNGSPWSLMSVRSPVGESFLVTHSRAGNPSYPAKTMNDLKLLPPAPIGCYVNHCVITATLAAIHSSNEWPFYKDDKWQTTYTEFQMEGREYSWTMHGERNYNFAPGAPVGYIDCIGRNHFVRD